MNVLNCSAFIFPIVLLVAYVCFLRSMSKMLSLARRESHDGTGLVRV